MEKTKNPELVDKIDDENLKETLKFVKSKNLMDFDEKNLLPKEKEDVKEIVVEKLDNFLRDKSDDLRQRISELRKKGADVEIHGFKSIHIPLKIKVFLATYSKKDFEMILEKIENLEKEISGLEKGSKKKKE